MRIQQALPLSQLRLQYSECVGRVTVLHEAMLNAMRGQSRDPNAMSRTCRELRDVYAQCRQLRALIEAARLGARHRW